MRRCTLAAMSNPIPNRFETASSGSTIPVHLDGAPGNAAAAGTSDLALTTLLADALGRLTSLPLRQYRGAVTIENFSNTPDELASLLRSAGVYDLGWRRFVRCTGEDRVRWLNGMVTNFVGGLQENAGCHAFVLNAQGRIQGDLDVYRRADSLWLETDAAQVEALTTFLDHYIIMDDVALELQPEWTVIGIAGPLAVTKLAEAGLPVPVTPLHIAEVTWQGHRVVVVAAYSPLVPRYEIWVERESVSDVWNTLTDAGSVPCGACSIEQLRILEGTPAYSVDITNKDLPHETNQMRALHFTKGCYLGQEIVERIHSRGNVHRTLSGFVLADASASPGAPLLADGKAVGEITSVASIVLPGMDERVVALGSIRREALERGLALMAGETVAIPSPLPFDFIGRAVQP
ncbi:MAG: CAF17-like 4Fe-4S cluster assembly/insertion protein YgfZ [Acidobacteriaceae bacterium]